MLTRGSCDADRVLTYLRTEREKSMQDRKLMESISKIYGHLADYESREIYKARLLYSLTGDYREICGIAARTAAAKKIREQIADFPGEPVWIWGTGFCADYLRRGFPEINWAGYVDNYRREEKKDGLPVLDADGFRETCRDAVVVISTILWQRDIYRQLMSYHFEPGRIVNAGKLMQELFEEQYFDLPFLTAGRDEVFVDAGCFDGLSVKGFLKWSEGVYREIIAFEPDRQCHDACRKELAHVKNLTLIPKGLWSSSGVLSFHETGASDSAIAENGEVQIGTVRLDDVAGEKNVTFLKMDIEGAEREALAGAAGTIRRCRPKLAVSIYHKPEDIWELPGLILDICPDYRFYIRHYSLRDAETVLYAV